MRSVFLFLSFFLCTVSSARDFSSVLRELGADQQLPVLTLKSESVRESEGYRYHSLELTEKKLGAVLISLREPIEPAISRPVVFLSTGFHVGRRSTELVGEIGDNVIVSFEYGLDELKHSVEKIVQHRQSFRQSGKVSELNEMQKEIVQLAEKLPRYIDEIKRIPIKVAAVLEWLKRKNQYGSFNLVAVSLGTQVIPLAQRLFEYHGGQIASSVFAYGGADVGLILKPLISEQMGPWQTALAVEIVRGLMNGYDSADHLGHLRSSENLVVHAKGEEIFSLDSQTELERLTPRPKEVLLLDGAHLNGNTDDLIRKFVKEVYHWGVDKRVINP